jgi:hypothetical protein
VDQRFSVGYLAHLNKVGPLVFRSMLETLAWSKLALGSVTAARRADVSNYALVVRMLQVPLDLACFFVTRTGS